MKEKLESKGFWTVTDYLQYALLVVSYFSSNFCIAEIEETAGGRLDSWTLRVSSEEIDYSSLIHLVNKAGVKFVRASQMEVFHLEDVFYEIEFTIS